MRRAAKIDKVKDDKSHLFAHYWRIVLPDADEGVNEYRFHQLRQWRFDWAMPEARVAVEVEGGVWIQGGHTRGAGYSANLEKYNEAAALGWIVLRFTPQMLDADPATCVKQVQRAIVNTEH